MTRHPLLTFLMGLAGFILLLPGVCAAGFIVSSGMSNADPSILSLWVVCFVIAAGGVVLLYKAFEKPSGPDDQPTSS
jgi:hypothetical protein